MQGGVFVKTKVEQLRKERGLNQDDFAKMLCHHIIRLILRVNFKTDIVCVFGVERKYAVIVAKIGDSRDDQDQTENAKKFFLHRWQPS